MTAPDSAEGTGVSSVHRSSKCAMTVPDCTEGTGVSSVRHFP
jgi:hypothetical protein